MKSKHIQRLLRLLITLLGAGLGVALTLAVVQVHTWTRPGVALPGGWLIGTYMGTALAGALLLYLLSPAMIAKCGEWVSALESYLDRLTLPQIAAGTSGLVCGLLIAALVSQILKFLGNSIFTTAFSAILYVLLGTTGMSVAKKRSDDIGALMSRLPVLRERRIVKKTDMPRPRVLDASVLLDGRIVSVCRTGFLAGELILPAFVQEELEALHASSDSVRRLRGKRGLEVLKRLRQESTVTLRIDATAVPEGQETDVRLFRLAQRLNACILTCDSALAKVADVADVPVLNLNDLAVALRTTVQTGEELLVTILKEGKEPGQGVAYMEDGTMVVVEGARELVGCQTTVVVTSALQTSAGRMIFAKRQEP